MQSPEVSILSASHLWQPEKDKVYSAECEMDVLVIECDDCKETHTHCFNKRCPYRHQVASLKPKDEKAGQPEDFPWPAKEPENVAGKWRVESSTSPITDTGDYFTQLWLTNGVVNLHSEKDDNEPELQLIADQLNKDEIPAANSHDMKDDDL